MTGAPERHISGHWPVIVGVSCIGGMLIMFSAPGGQLAMMQCSAAVAVLLLLCGVRPERMWSAAGRCARLCALVFILSILLKMLWVVACPYTEYQHDSGPFDAGEGHAAYIFALADNGLRLLDIPPQSRWTFYNPPLHYWLGALWITVVRAFRPATTGVQLAESLQWLMLLYTTLAAYLGYHVLAALQLRGQALAMAFCYWCLLPIMLFLSGSLAPDALLTLISVAALWCTIKWCEHPSLTGITAVGLLCGLALLTKTTGLLTCVAALLLILVKTVWEGLRRTRAALHAAMLLGMTALVGGWWHLWALFRFKMPLGYMQKQFPINPQNVSGYSVAERLFDIFGTAFSPFFILGDYNIPLTLLKTATFDEIRGIRSPSPEYACGAALLGTHAVLGFLAATMLAIACIKGIGKIRASRKTAKNAARKALPAAALVPICAIVYLAAILAVSFREPFTCTMSYRYIVPLSLPMAFFLGRCAETRGLRWTSAVTLLLFGVLNLSFYIPFLLKKLPW